jgi:muramidase (phage lysozyme)
MNKDDAIKNFFDTALKGESKTYNDHNWYVGSKVKGYIEGVSSNKYPLLTKNVSDSTIADLKQLQAHPRDSNGQLFAIGRYQIIPNTLKGIQKTLNISDSTKFSKEIQDKMGYGLMRGRTNLKNYLDGKLEDNKENRQKASLDMSKIWASIGVPYPVNGKSTNESYYPNDKASIKTELIQDKLQELRKNLTKVSEPEKKNSDTKINYKYVGLGLLLVISGYFVYNNRKLLKL